MVTNRHSSRKHRPTSIVRYPRCRQAMSSHLTAPDLTICGNRVNIIGRRSREIRCRAHLIVGVICRRRRCDRIDCGHVHSFVCIVSPRIVDRTAFRHRSPQCMRTPVSHVSSEGVDPETLEPLVSETGGPVAPRESVLVAGQNGESLRHIAINGGEFPRSVPKPEVAGPTTQHRVELLHHDI